jgi:hypothetical protein
MKRQSQQVTPPAMAIRQVLIADILNVKPAIIKSLFHGQLEPAKAQNYLRLWCQCKQTDSSTVLKNRINGINA